MKPPVVAVALVGAVVLCTVQLDNVIPPRARHIALSTELRLSPARIAASGTRHRLPLRLRSKVGRGPSVGGSVLHRGVLLARPSRQVGGKPPDQRTFSPSLASSPSTSMREAILLVRVNGDEVSGGSILLEDANGTWYASVEDMQRWHISIDGRATIAYGGRRFVALTPVDGLSVRFDGSQQSIDLEVAASFRGLTNIGEPIGTRPTTPGSSAAYVNYAIHSVSGSGSNITNGYFEGGWSQASGASIASSFLANNVLGRGPIVRLETTLRRDFAASRTSLAIGDTMTSGGVLVIPVRFAGVSFGTNFATVPGFVTFPQPTLGGFAAEPSTIGVSVNGIAQNPQNIPAGPFTLSDVPVVTGAGQVEVAVTDALGRTRFIDQSYYASPDMLKSGLSNFSYSAGFERFDYALRPADYGPGFASATFRHGFSDRFTGGSDLQAGAGHTTLALEGVVQPGDAGVVSLSAAASTSATSGGYDVGGNYAYTNQRVTARYQFSFASPGFRQLGRDIAFGSASRSTLASVSYALGRAGSIGAAYVRAASPGVDVRSLSGSYARPVGAGQMFLTYARSGLNGAAITAMFVTSLGPRSSALASHTVEAGSALDTVAVQENPPLGISGSGYAIQVDRGSINGGRAAFTEQTRSGATTVALQSADGKTVATGDVLGGYVSAGGVGAWSSSAGSSFGIAVLPGYPDVRVLVNNAEVGRTDARGVVPLANLLPYQANVVSIDPDDLPPSANIKEFSKTIVPAAGHAVVVLFAASAVGGVLFEAFASNGLPLPAGTILSVDGMDVGIVAADGASYVSGVRPGPVTIVARHEDVSWSMTITVPHDLTDIPDIGRVVCRSAKG